MGEGGAVCKLRTLGNVLLALGQFVDRDEEGRNTAHRLIHVEVREESFTLTAHYGLRAAIYREQRGYAEGEGEFWIPILLLEQKLKGNHNVTLRFDGEQLRIIETYSGVELLCAAVSGEGWVTPLGRFYLTPTQPDRELSLGADMLTYVLRAHRLLSRAEAAPSIVTVHGNEMGRPVVITMGAKFMCSIAQAPSMFGVEGTVMPWGWRCGRGRG